MDREARQFRVKSAIMGGGLAFREGEVVTEDQLRGHAEMLRRLGGLEELSAHAQAEDPPERKAYTA